MKTFFDLIKRLEQEDSLSERRALADALHRSLAFCAGDGKDVILAGVRLLAVGGEADALDIEAKTGVTIESVRAFQREHKRLIGGLPNE